MDPAGDMVAAGPGAGGDTGDFLRTGVRHGRYGVVVRSHFNDLDAGDGTTMQVIYFTNEHRRAETPDFWRMVLINGTQVHRYNNDPTNSQNSHFSCDGLLYNIDYSADKFFLRLPRGCLERPRWVRVQVTDNIEAGPEFETSWSDDALASPGSGGMTPRLFRQPQ
jgi:hypothetical protein